MKITWYGHACFRLETDQLSIVTDPYTPERAGLDPVEDQPDVLVMSSALDPAHSNAAMIPDAGLVLNALDAVSEPKPIGAGVTVWAVAAREGDDRPDDPKANAMYGMTLDGVQVCHMGDIGIPMSRTQLDALRGRADVLLALAGGGRTIAIDDLLTAIDYIQPRLIVPMHYWTPGVRYNLGHIEELLQRWVGPVQRLGVASLEVAPDSLPSEPTIVTLLPKSDPVAFEVWSESDAH
jgi:L-ascorbate metabolism protein UlaG (beta-lactamase superfamily)